MKRYTSRLETVLRVRRVQMDLAVAATGRAAAAADEAARASDDRRAHYERTVSGARPVDAVPAVLAHRQRSGLAARAALAAGGAADEATAAHLTAVADLRDRQARLSVLERLERERRDQHGAMTARDEASALDDLAASRFVRGPRP